MCNDLVGVDAHAAVRQERGPVHHGEVRNVARRGRGGVVADPAVGGGERARVRQQRGPAHRLTAVCEVDDDTSLVQYK